MKKLEMWAGLECTLNRVQDRFIDQADKNGHNKRLSDLELFSSLGVKKVRYPCLWEKVAPVSLDNMDWSDLDQKLTELKRLGITPIAGFLHHGSGPRYTDLLDKEFPEKLASYAKAFAERYPWIEEYTPVNEILTTARFSCLYGHWYPHHQSEASFMRAAFNQVKGTILAMKAIREVIPHARLIQTDDLGRAQGTEPLKYQVEFENERRWLGWDLLCGKVNESHPIYWYAKLGITQDELMWLADNACPPDVIGINHYHLSNRFLDHRMDLYPVWSHGGNGRHQYADVGAVDTGQAELPSPSSIMLEAWERYQLPIAITEVHTMGHRDSQMRWMYEVWNEAKLAQMQGANILAITAWSLLGTYDWHKLCTQCEMFYEPGVFDLRSPDKKPRATAVSRLIKELATLGDSSHPILARPGWWKTSRRILWAARDGAFSPIHTQRKTPKLLITGASGTLGQAFARICGERNIPYKLLSRSEMDICDIKKVREVVSEIKPWAVINAAGFVRVLDAENEIDRCFKENAEGPFNLAAVCAEMALPLVHFSSDLVFDGEKNEPYVESEMVSPQNVYGHSKAHSEKNVLTVNPKALVIRTSSFFGPWDEYNFVTKTLNALLENETVSADDSIVSPTYVPDLVNACLDLLLDGERGIVHLTNKSQVSWAQFAHKVVDIGKEHLSVDSNSIVVHKTGAKNTSLTSERFSLLPPLDDALIRYFKHRKFNQKRLKETHI